MNVSKPAHCAACGAEQLPEVSGCAQCGAAAVDAAPTSEPSLLEEIRAQQKRVAKQLAPLESERGWWKKYF